MLSWPAPAVKDSDASLPSKCVPNDGSAISRFATVRDSLAIFLSVGLGSGAIAFCVLFWLQGILIAIIGAVVVANVTTAATGAMIAFRFDRFSSGRADRLKAPEEENADLKKFPTEATRDRAMPPERPQENNDTKVAESLSSLPHRCQEDEMSHRRAC